MKILFVMVGGFLGAISRFSLGILLQSKNIFPFSTLCINLIGCLFLGWFLTFIHLRTKGNEKMTLLIGTGFTGSFTTFSTFSVETIQLFQSRHALIAILYALSSTIFGLFFIYLGRKIATMKGKEGKYI